MSKDIEYLYDDLNGARYIQKVWNNGIQGAVVWYGGFTLYYFDNNGEEKDRRVIGEWKNLWKDGDIPFQEVKKKCIEWADEI